MIHAYDEYYLDDAMANLGEAMDYAVHCCHFTMDKFLDLFITSGVSKQFGKGMPKFVSGMSGTELVLEVMRKSGSVDTFDKVQVEYDYSTEYWCGWILAYYQWYTGRSFKDIKKHISMEKIADLYPTLHEAAEDKFVDTVNHIIKKSNYPTRLQKQRKIAGYTQSELAEKSGVSIRSIQQYEQRAKDINKASAVNLFALAKVLGCRAEDLIEYDVQDIVEE